MEIIRATRTKVDGTIIASHYMRVTPPPLAFQKETDETDFIKREYVSGIEALKPEIKITGFPGGVAGFMSFCGTTPVIEVWGSYTGEASCTPKTAYMKLEVQVLAADVPEFKAGRIEDQMLQLGKTLSYQLTIDGVLVYDINSGYGTDEPKLMINGEDYLNLTGF
jgi:hypothetical protein